MMHDNNLTCEMEWKQIEKTYKHLRGDQESSVIEQNTRKSRFTI